MKKIFAAAMTVICSASMLSVIPAPVTAADPSFYEEEEYEDPVDMFTYKESFIEKDSKTYCIGDDGKMLTGDVCFYDGYGQPHYYYFRKDGSMFTGFIRRKDKQVYYYIEDKSAQKYGELVTGGEFTVNGKEYMFNYAVRENIGCYKLSGWVANRYYKKNGGKIRHKKIRIDGQVYYFDENGHSVPASLKKAEPDEFEYIGIGTNADTASLECGMGYAYTFDEEMTSFRGIYSGTVLVEGEEADIRIFFDRYKNITDVSIKAKGDHVSYFEDIFDDKYDRKNKTGSIYYSSVCEDGNSGENANISYNNGYTEVYYDIEAFEE